MEYLIVNARIDDTGKKMHGRFGITPTKVSMARPASLCSVFIRKCCWTPSGDLHFGTGTGFHYRDANGQTWLMTNWHVLTGRRPDNPGILLSGAPRSPYRIEVTYPGPKSGTFLQPAMLNLYEDGRAVWREYKRDLGIDLAGIPIQAPPGSIATCVQDFAERNEATLQPGMDLVVVGFPFEHGTDMPFPVWKRAMVATEPAYKTFGLAQSLLDTPGTPGMSGSPVYRIANGLAVTKEQHQRFKAAERGEISALEFITSLDVRNPDVGISLKFVGVYAGTTGTPGLDRLSLGRMMLGSFCDLIAMDGEYGKNPFPPENL